MNRCATSVTEIVVACKSEPDVSALRSAYEQQIEDLYAQIGRLTTVQISMDGKGRALDNIFIDGSGGP